VTVRFAISLILLLILSTRALAAEPPILIGSLNPLTGPNAPDGKACDNGIRLAVEERVASGGVLNRSVDVLTRDSAATVDPKATQITLPDDPAAAAALLLIEGDQVCAIIGDVTTDGTLSAAPECQRFHVPLIAPTSTSPKISRTQNFIFRACFASEAQTPWVVHIAGQLLNAHRGALMYDPRNEDAAAVVKNLRASFAKVDGKIIVERPYKSGDTNFKNQLQTIAQAKCDVIFLPGVGGEIPVLLKQARELGITCPFVGSDGWYDSNLLTSAGDAAEGCYFTTQCDLYDPDEKIHAFVTHYKARFEGADPTSSSLLGYDAANLLLNAIERSGKSTGRDIRAALLETKNFPALTGSITIDKDRQTIKPGVIMKIESGRFVFVQRTGR
jgi:branched-chain amino acid transport system substrate-binding protein